LGSNNSDGIKELLKNINSDLVFYAGSNGNAYGIPEDYCFRDIDKLSNAIQPYMDKRHKLTVLMGYDEEKKSYPLGEFACLGRHFNLTFFTVGHYPSSEVVRANLDGIIVDENDCEKELAWAEEYAGLTNMKKSKCHTPR
jgi:hypothetical protein